MKNAKEITALLDKIKDLLAEEEEEKSPVEIDNLTKILIKDCDEPSAMTWREAVKKFGENGTDKKWRLPTQEELHIMYLKRNEIPNITDGYYWSSRENNSNNAYNEKFSDGYQNYFNKNNNYLVRCVRR
jgi:hypothetical protein